MLIRCGVLRGVSRIGFSGPEGTGSGHDRSVALGGRADAFYYIQVLRWHHRRKASFRSVSDPFEEQRRPIVKTIEQGVGVTKTAICMARSCFGAVPFKGGRLSSHR